MALDQRSIHRKMLVAGKPGSDRLPNDTREEALRQTMLAETLAIVREDRWNEDIFVGRHVQEPSKQHVSLQSPTELALRSNRVKRLQQQRLQQSFRCNRRTTAMRVRLAEITVHAAQRIVHHPLDRTKWVIPLDEVFEIHAVPESAVGFVVSAHGESFARDTETVF